MWRDPDRGPAKHGGVLFFKISVTSSFGEEGLPCTHGDRLCSSGISKIFEGLPCTHGDRSHSTSNLLQRAGLPCTHGDRRSLFETYNALRGLPCTHGDRLIRATAVASPRVSHAHMGTGVTSEKYPRLSSGSPMHTWEQEATIRKFRIVQEVSRAHMGTNNRSYFIDVK